MKNTRSLVLIALISGSSWGQNSMFEGAPGQPGNVVVLTPSEVRPPELQGIRLLPLEAVGRTQLESLLPGRAARRTDVPGAARLTLPGECGSLYKFRRPELNGTVSFGFFLVGADGKARALFELPGTGIVGGDDPLPGRVACDRSGHSFLVASSLAAGGALWEIDCTTSGGVNRTQGLAPMDFGRNGLVLLDSWGLGVTSAGAVRFDRQPGALASKVSMPITAPWFGPDVVRSEDGSTVAFLAGNDDDCALVFSCRQSGAAVQASDQPMHIEGAGFLPEDTTGPHLALSTDGSWVAWRAQGVEAECFVRETRPGPRPTDQQLTGPANFDDTLNDTGVIAFVDPDSLVLITGLHSATGIERGDFFRADVDPASATVVTNLSGTSGILSPPYDYGYLETHDGFYQAPGSPSAYLTLDYKDKGSLLWIHAGGSTSLLDEVTSLDSVEVAGNYLVAAVTRPPGAVDPMRSSLSLVQIPLDGTTPMLVTLPDGCRLSRTMGSRSRAQYAAVLEFMTGERLGRVPVPSPNGFAISPTLFSYGPTVGFAENGAILATVQIGTDRTAFAWSTLGTALLRTSRLETFLLPGL